MYEILKKKQLNSEICLLEIAAEDIALAAEPGHFVIIRTDRKGERFPLTLFEWDNTKGSITVICQAVGVSTKKLCGMSLGDELQDVAGPLGAPANIAGYKRVACIGGGVGTAEAYPIAKSIHDSGGEVTGVIGFRNKELVICEDLLGEICKELYVTTDDGSKGQKGYVTDVLEDLLEKGDYDLVFAIGPVPMMEKVSETTRSRGIKTLVSLNSLMIDGTGMCGGCRVLYDGKMRFCCVDGPEFDAHKIDFNDLALRQRQYLNKEKTSLEHYEKDCKIGLEIKNEREKA